MRWPFRRKTGRHQLGAAVTDIPSAPRPAPMPAPPAPPPPPPIVPARGRSESPAPQPEPVSAALPTAPPAEAAAPPAEAAALPVEAPAEPAPSPVPEPPPGPRVELGFRDGSTAALAPDSAQAKALTSLASILTQRDDSPEDEAR